MLSVSFFPNSMGTEAPKLRTRPDGALPLFIWLSSVPSINW